MGNKRFYAALGMVEKLAKRNLDKLDCEILFILETLKTEFVDSTISGDTCSNKFDAVCLVLSAKVFEGDFNLLCANLIERKRRIRLDIVVENLVAFSLNQLDCAVKQKTLVLLNRGHDVDFSNFDIEGARGFAKFLENLGEHELACEAVQIVIEKSQRPFYEWHFKGMQFEKLNYFSAALECFSSFLLIAINEGNEQAIQIGIEKVVGCIILSDLNEVNIEAFLTSIPKHITYNAQALLKEAYEIIEFRRLNQLQEKSKALGYHYFSETNIKDFINRELEVIKVHPNFNSFYELSKAYAVIGEETQAKAHLKVANDLNAFLFYNPSEIGAQSGNV